jgi:hypothetical protein
MRTQAVRRGQVVDALGRSVAPAIRVVRSRRQDLRDNLAEHRRLRASLEALEAILASAPRLDAHGWRTAVVEQLDRLHGELAVHFAEEESRGLFVAIAETGPSGTVASRRLLAEHARLLKDLSRLRTDAERGSTLKSQAGWVRRAGRVLAALADHEARENRCLFDAVEPAESAGD